MCKACTQNCCSIDIDAVFASYDLHLRARAALSKAININISTIEFGQVRVFQQQHQHTPLAMSSLTILYHGHRERVSVPGNAPLVRANPLNACFLVLMLELYHMSSNTSRRLCRHRGCSWRRWRRPANAAG